MAAAEKSLWVQVMEAGFGATLEAHGFRKVSPRLYRLEGDGITWEQFTFRGPKGFLNTIREGNGAVVAGLDEIFRRAYGDRPQDYRLLPIRNNFCGRPYHSWGTIGYDYQFMDTLADEERQREVDALRRRFDEARPWTRRERFLRFFGHERRPARDLVKITPHYRRHDYAYDVDYWIVGDTELFRDIDSEPYVPSPSDLKELADLLSFYWTEITWTFGIGKRLSIYDYAVERYSRPPHASGYFDEDSALFNHLAGRHDLVRANIEWPIERSLMTLAQVRDYLEADDPGFLERRPMDYGTPEWHMDSEERAALRCEQWFRTSQENAERARRLAAAIGLKV